MLGSKFKLSISVKLTFMLRRCYLLGIKQLKLYGKEIEIGGRHPVKIDSS